MITFSTSTLRAVWFSPFGSSFLFDSMVSSFCERVLRSLPFSLMIGVPGKLLLHLQVFHFHAILQLWFHSWLCISLRQVFWVLKRCWLSSLHLQVVKDWWVSASMIREVLLRFIAKLQGSPQRCLSLVKYWREPVDFSHLNERSSTIWSVYLAFQLSHPSEITGLLDGWKA
jgi:hypothetical protein